MRLSVNMTCEHTSVESNNDCRSSNSCHTQALALYLVVVAISAISHGASEEGAMKSSFRLQCDKYMGTRSSRRS